MTLIEIMSSILVLSIGLVGVLAAIPFGGFRMAQMSEADNSSLVGRDAVRMMKINNWANPQNWYLKENNPPHVFASDPRSILVNGSTLTGLNLTYPFFVDPLGNNSYTPAFFASADPGFFYTAVAPAIGTGNLSIDRVNGLVERYERAFYLPDDVMAGYDATEDETEYRPRMETEDDLVLGNGSIPAFTGRYSWMATVYPNPGTSAFYDCPLPEIHAADYDVVVMKDRILGDEKGFKVTVDGSGKMGGTVTIDLSSMVDNLGGNASDSLDRARLLEQLDTTRYLMLMGNDDIPVDGNLRVFARWYKIANYSVVAKDDAGDPLTIRASLIGPDTPNRWSGSTVSGLFFPGVVGVYSGAATF
ncbi:MAG: hypothetical protein IIY32_09915 [Thermoguttaceae bacterium]|nr:hypothetical protein [Thermoguttaceae bacterium]